MPPLAGELSGAFQALNRNKRSVSIDLKNEKGREVFLRLVRTADVLVDSFRPGTLEKLALGPTLIARENARLIHVAISGYGATGPDRLKAGHDLNYQARAGLLAISGGRRTAGHDAGSATPHLHAPHVQFADVVGGAFTGAISVLAALFARERDGAGRFVDVSMTEGALYGSAMLFGFAEGAGRWARAGCETLTGELPCYNVYETSDGKLVALAALEPKFWAAFCSAAERDDLLAYGHDPSDAALEAVRTAFRTRSEAEWISLGVAHDICLSPILTGQAVFDDPHHQARETFSTLSVGGRSLRLPAPPFRGLCKTHFQAAPSLGADNLPVLRDLGYAADEVVLLARDAAIGPTHVPPDAARRTEQPR